MSSAAPWDGAPCGLLLLRADGTIVAANPAFLDWVGREAEDVVDRLRLPELLSVGGRIYWETHLAPLLHVDGRVEEVALELRAPSGRLPVLLTAVARDDGLVHAAVSSARERSRYERELLAARRSADGSAARLRALQTVTAALSSALGLDAVADALVDAAIGPLGAAAASLWLAAEDGLAPHGSRGEDTGDAQLPPGVTQRHDRTAADVDGRIVVALHGATALRGVLSLLSSGDAGADAPDLELLTAVGQQAGLALDRALLHEQSASVAHELQHSLLAVDAPVDTRFAVATAYRAGVEMLEVGGDWYDVFLADEGVLSVVVGDVVGRGLGAASAMGQLRSAVRAVSGPGTGPAAVFQQLDRFVEQAEAASLATVAHAQVELASGRVRYACAGHPPPLLMPRDGPPRLLWQGRSTPLGAFVSATDRHDAVVQLSAGDRLLLYTDGLVERRDRALDEQLAALEATVADLVDVSLELAVRILMDRLLADEQHRDDVCVLLLEWTGPVFERHVPADLRTLGQVRRDLGRWLGDCGVEPDTRDDVVLAVSEALANAAEHGSGWRPTERVDLRVRLECDKDGAREVVVQVHDAGRWRTPTASPERGRGLMIVAALVDDVVVDTGDGTSVLLRRRLVRSAG